MSIPDAGPAAPGDERPGTLADWLADEGGREHELEGMVNRTVAALRSSTGQAQSRIAQQLADSERFVTTDVTLNFDELGTIASYLRTKSDAVTAAIRKFADADRALYIGHAGSPFGGPGWDLAGTLTAAAHRPADSVSATLTWAAGILKGLADFAEKGRAEHARALQTRLTELTTQPRPVAPPTAPRSPA
jgi:hypothetical protein